MKKFFNKKKVVSTMFAILLIFTGIFYTNKSVLAGVFLQKTDSEITQIIKQTETDKSTFLAVTDASRLTTLDLFFKVVAKNFMYPFRSCIFYFSEQLQNLEWIKGKRIVWILKGFTDSPIPKINKEAVKYHIEEAILPYWDGEEGLNPRPKPFDIFYS